eukprot:TRINITY_DN20471_c0_g1_i1.p1 TRINITY_DN20471_c0_g1~~TRINITY_DN20471_c0_g1_i1.p1  ORF type:complete len:162 (+),score=31.12 TRINITY_DN20471_c0_g1_i1:44-529(+)
MRTRSRSNSRPSGRSTGSYSYCVVAPGVGGEPPKAPVYVRLHGDTRVGKLREKVKEFFSNPAVLYHNGKRIDEGRTAGDLGLNRDTTNVIQIHYTELGQGAGLDTELKEALAHLQVLRNRVDRQSEVFTCERQARLQVEDRLLQSVPLEAIDSLVEKYRMM